jgi:hypothetical protein
MSFHRFNPALPSASPLSFPICAALVLLLAPSCSSTGTRAYATPEEATTAIITAAGAGDVQEAGRIFDSFAADPVERDRVYAAVFNAASERYEAGNSAEAANLLTFVTEHYPNAAAAREALVYALFLERAESGAMAAASTGELKAAITSVRAGVTVPPTWVELAATQVAIDDGELARARETFDAFLTTWDQQPSGLALYVEDIDRYLQSH